MRRWHLLVALAAGAVVMLAAGCGRMVMPGKQFREPVARTSSTKPVQSPLPEKPILEAGDEHAKVRVVAFFPIDKDHQRLVDLVMGLAKAYPGKVYVRYVDYRTPEGAQVFANAQMTTRGVLINSKNEITIRAKPRPYTVDFAQDMGRYWTAEDLERAVAQEVEAAYGK